MFYFICTMLLILGIINSNLVNNFNFKRDIEDILGLLLCVVATIGTYLYLQHVNRG